jgi:APA family basic amino acid/polyamine antiporter
MAPGNVYHAVSMIVSPDLSASEISSAAGPQRTLGRVLRVRDGLAVLMGSLVGMGILRTPGIIAGYLGSPWAILGIWLVGGIVAALSALVLAELASAFPQAGGKYVYAREAFGPVAGFVAGWSELAVVKAFSAAAKAVVIAEYLILLSGRGSVRTLALVVILAFAALNLGGLKLGTVVQNITTVIKVAIIAAIAATACLAGGPRGFAPDVIVSPETNWLLGFAISYQLVTFSYYGFDDVGKMAEEIRNPGRTIPLILLGGAALVTVLYMLIIAAFLSALTPAQMAQSPLVAQTAIAGVLGQTAGTIMTVAAIFIIMSTLNTNLLVMPRVAFALSRGEMGPRAFTRVSRKGTPVPALLFVTVLVLGLTVTGAFEILIRFNMLVALSMDLVVFFGFFRLRRLQPDLSRPFRVPWYPWLPILTIVLYVLIVAVIVGTQPQLALGTVAIALILIVLGVVTVRRQRDIANEPTASEAVVAGKS